MKYSTINRALLEMIEQNQKILFVRPSDIGFMNSFDSYEEIKGKYPNSITLSEARKEQFNAISCQIILFNKEEANAIVNTLLNDKETIKNNMIEILVDYLYEKEVLLRTKKILIIIGMDNNVSNHYKWMRSLDVQFAKNKEDVFEIIGSGRGDMKSILIGLQLTDLSNDIKLNLNKSSIITGFLENIEIAPTFTAKITSCFDYMSFISKLIEFYYIQKKNLPYNEFQIKNSILESNKYLESILEQNDYIYDSYINFNHQITDSFKRNLIGLEKWIPITIQDDAFTITDLIYYIKEIRNIVVAHGIISEELAPLLYANVYYCSMLLSKALKIDDFNCSITDDELFMSYVSDTPLTFKNNSSKYFIIKNNCLCLLWDNNRNKDIYINFFDGEHFTPSYE